MFVPKTHFLRLLIFIALSTLSVKLNGQPFNALLSAGTWGKMAVDKHGVYRVNSDLLKKMGFDPGKIDPRKIRIYGNPGGMLPQANSAARPHGLIENAIYVEGEADGKFDKNDFVLFYAEGPDRSYFDTSKGTFYHETNLYATQNFYFITVSDAEGKRIQTKQNAGTGFPVISEFDDYGFYEKEEYNDLESGRVWYGDRFGISNADLTLTFPIEGISASAPITFISDVMGQSYTNSSFDVYLNDVQIIKQEIEPIPNTRYGVKGIDRRDTVSVSVSEVSADSKNSQAIKFHFNKGEGSSQAFLDYLLFSFKRKLAQYGEQTIFQSGTSLENTTSQFTVDKINSGSLIWDVTNFGEAALQDFSVNGNQATFSAEISTLKKFIVFNKNAPLPVTAVHVAPQGLRSVSTPDMVIVAHPLFFSAANTLKEHRWSLTNWDILVVTPEQIFNEFSSGRPDVSAIRDFMKHLYDQNPTKLKTLLLFGKSSFDYKDRIPGNSNYVLTYESRNSLHPLLTYSSDDFFGFLEDNEGEWAENASTNYTLHIGVGRLPVTTPKEAQDVVDKIMTYDFSKKSLGSWRKRIVFVADDGNNEDGFTSLHQSQANQLSEFIESVNPNVDSKKMFMGSFEKVIKAGRETIPKVTEEIVRSFDRGSLIINYTGHGNEYQWADEKVFSDTDIEALDNKLYPFMVTATCEFGRHDNPRQISSAELLVKKEKGGAIGMVTTARPVNATTNFNLNRAFYDALLQQEDGHYANIGEVFRKTKNNSTSGVSNRNFSLLGDPSLTLALPARVVRISSIKTVNGSDTLKALSTVMATGEIVSLSGEKMIDFNGTVEATLFDKQTDFVTIGKNDPAFHYSQWYNALFRGTATVSEGEFTMEFMLPKNIDYAVGEGKLSLYASDPKTHYDAIGSYTDFKIGEVEPNVPQENNAPSVRIFLGDTTFVDGGITSPDTDLIAFLDDDTGINIFDNGAGTSIVGTLDDGAETFVLNDYFVASTDDASSGWINYPMTGLAPGKHSITIHATDLFNNTAEGRIEFFVTDGESIVIENFGNYPNPVQENSTLFFTHNRSGDDLQAQLFIQKTTGELVNKTVITIPESDYQVDLVELNTLTNDKKLPAGLYVARLVVRSLTNGSKNEQVTKLIILN